MEKYFLSMVLPLLDFVQELPENRLSEVIGQTVGHIVSYEGFYDSLERKKGNVSCNFSTYTAETRSLRPLYV